MTRKQYMKIWANKNKEKIKIKRREKYLRNKEHENSLSLKYYNTHKKQILKYLKQYAKQYRAEKKLYYYNYKKDRRKKDLNYRLRDIISTRIRIAMKSNTSKSRKSRPLLGCSIKALRIHLEKQFTKKMSWDNYGKYWEIDHIRPCASFDLTKISEQKKCFHYSNLQPLTVSENRKKHAKVEGV